MRGLWRRRPVRRAVIGLLPLLVVSGTLAAVLAARFSATAAPVREATARATATVQRSGLDPDGRGVELRWTDGSGTERTSRVVAQRAGTVPAGRRVEIRYQPSDPSRVFVGGDETSARLRDLAFSLGVTVLVPAVALIMLLLHVSRRLSAERRPGATLSVDYARSRRGLAHRSWLVVEEQGKQWWVPVHWDPVLPRLARGTPAVAHGLPSRHAAIAVEVNDTMIWQAAGRRRGTPPRGEIWRAEPGEPATGRRRQRGDTKVPPGAEPPRTPAARADCDRAGLVWQFRADAALLIAAPLLGLLWSYLSEGGLASWAGATLLAAAVLFWWPTMLGSDPS
jgi:hypothetical protein